MIAHTRFSHLFMGLNTDIYVTGITTRVATVSGERILPVSWLILQWCGLLVWFSITLFLLLCQNHSKWVGSNFQSVDHMKNWFYFLFLWFIFLFWLRKILRVFLLDKLLKIDKYCFKFTCEINLKTNCTMTFKTLT